MVITAIVPARAGQSVVERCLAQLALQVREPAHIVIVDETDDEALTLDYGTWEPGLRSTVRDPDRQPGERNPGFARNYGAELARYDTTHFLFCDVGIFFPRDALSSLVACADGDENGIYSARWVGLPNTAPKFESADEAALWGKSHGYQSDDGAAPRFEEYHWNLDHQFTLFPRKLFEELGGYDTDAFPDWGLECQDLSLRILQKGGTINSRVPRELTGTQLCIYHPWHPAPRDPMRRSAQFLKKWGVPWGFEIVHKCQQEGQKHALADKADK